MFERFSKLITKILRKKIRAPVSHATRPDSNLANMAAIIEAGTTEVLFMNLYENELNYIYINGL